MSYFKLANNGVNYAVRDHGTLSNLRRIMDRNSERFLQFINLGNRTLENQNPLVAFLQHMSVDVEWSQDYLINVIHQKAQQIASLVDLTSLYNRGKNHPLSFYPETNHHTLLVVPFGKASTSHINDCLSIPLTSLTPLYPIYTTDTTQRWDISMLLDTVNRKAKEDLFTIINVDVYALVIGYWRWLKRGGNWGNSPHGYLASYPLMNLYLAHNELENFNYLNGNRDKFAVQEGAFALEGYTGGLDEYSDYKHRYMLSNPMKSFTQFYQINQRTNLQVDTNQMVFPDAYKSLFFVQMSWVWSLAQLGMVDHYLYYNNILGSVDGLMSAELKLYYQKVQLQSQINQIKADKWDDHFLKVWTKVKTYTQ